MVGAGVASCLPLAGAGRSIGHLSSGAAIYKFAAAGGHGHVADPRISRLCHERDVRHDDAGALALGHPVLGRGPRTTEAALSGHLCSSDYVVRFDEILRDRLDSAARGVFGCPAGASWKLGLVPPVAHRGSDRISALDEGGIRAAHDFGSSSYVGWGAASQ